jgi:hypothetical protein
MTSGALFVAHYMRKGTDQSVSSGADIARWSGPFGCSLLTDGKEDAIIMRAAICVERAGDEKACGKIRPVAIQPSAVFLQRFFKQHSDHIRAGPLLMKTDFIEFFDEFFRQTNTDIRVFRPPVM